MKTITNRILAATLVLGLIATTKTANANSVNNETDSILVTTEYMMEAEISEILTLLDDEEEIWTEDIVTMRSIMGQMS